MIRRFPVVALVLAVLVRCGSGGDGSDGKGNKFQVGGTATLLVTPDPISFPAVDIDTEYPETVTIRNDPEAGGVLQLTSVRLEEASADFSITQPEKMELLPGESTTMVVLYRPKDSVYDSGKLVIEHHNQVAPRIVPITTLQQTGVLLVQPNPIAFGSVAGGTSKVIGARIRNTGSDDLQIGSTVLSVDSSKDYAVTATYQPTGEACTPGAAVVEYPFTLVHGTSYCVDVSYTPKGGGSDQGKLLIYPPYDATLPSQVARGEAAVSGVEVGPEIKLVPGAMLDFGPVALNTEKVLTLLVQNDGTQDLIVDGVKKGEQVAAPFAAIEVLTAVAAGTVVPKGEANAIKVEVRFKPTETWPVTYGPLGYIEVTSNDGDEGTSLITVFGQVASPKLQLSPPDLVDFGIVALNKTSDRTLTLTNVGTVDLDVTKLEIGQNSPASEFAVKTAPPLPVKIAPNGALNVTLSFLNKGGPAGEQVHGKLALATSDPGGATEMELRATRTDTAKCVIELEPATLNFGTVPFGHEKTMTLNMHNVGSAPCSWSHATVHDGAGGLFPGFPTTCSAGQFSTSQYFQIVDPPPAIKDLIKPGLSWPLQVKFVPEASFWSMPNPFDPEALIAYSGAVQVHVLDYENLKANGNPTEVTSPEGAQGAAIACNLQGKSGPANIAAIPGEVDFGLTTVGCHSQTTTITIYNTGKAPLSLCDIKLEGCTPEFKLKNLPPIPACDANGGGIVLTSSSPVKIDVVYAPQDLTKDGCSVVIESTDADSPAISVPLTGGGTYDSEQTDTFTQLSGQLVDVLFIVDNSGSMSEEQDSLSSNFQYLVNVAQQWGSIYHLGVVSTDIDDTNATKGELRGDPRFVGSNDVAKFASSVKLGDNGSGTEQGLAAAQMALTLPITMDPDPPKACTKDDDCAKPTKCVPSVDQPGTKRCGGWNMEFLRKDASLEIVFVSDEEDQSPATLSFYIDFFKSIKGYANANLFHAHAIVGDHGSGCQGAGGAADAGDRYIEVAGQTGGIVHSICDANWAQNLKDIGNIAFGLKVQFFLSRPAIPDTITVTVDGKPCTDGWSFAADSNSVIFDESGSCMPQEGQQIDIHYEVICYSE